MLIYTFLIYVYAHVDNCQKNTDNNITFKLILLKYVIEYLTVFNVSNKKL